MRQVRPKSAWEGIDSVVELLDRRRRCPRNQGITMVIDTGIGPSELRDVLSISGPYIDHWKFAFGTSALMEIPVLQEKLALLHEQGILAYPGGTLLEVAIVNQDCRVFLDRAVEVGFSGVEVSDGTIHLSRNRRREVIEAARKAGLVVVSEVGRKSPDEQPSATELAEQVLIDIESGASWVTVEARESGLGIGIYNCAGQVRVGYLETILEAIGDNVSHVLWEAPQRSQQLQLIRRLGPNVSLGNIDPRACLALEALRCGLRYDTLSDVVQQWQQSKLSDDSASESAVTLVEQR